MTAICRYWSQANLVANKSCVKVIECIDGEPPDFNYTATNMTRNWVNTTNLFGQSAVYTCKNRYSYDATSRGNTSRLSTCIQPDMTEMEWGYWSNVS